jgi:flagellar basal body rod protein FlgC
MGIFDAMNVAENAMSVHRFRSEIAAQNIANVYTPGYHRREVNLEATAFTTALDGAKAGRNGGVEMVDGTGDASEGAVRVQSVTTVAGHEFDERQQALQGVTDMMRAKSAFELNSKAATLLKSMALSSLEIGRGA